MTQPLHPERRAEYWSRFIESVADGIVVLDPEGICRQANSPARLMLGFSEEDMRSTPLHALVHPVDNHFDDCALCAALEPDNEWRLFEDLLTTSSGDLLPVEISAWPVYLEGILDSYTVSFQSRDFREHRADDLARSARLANIGAMAASIVHEFNNILMGIAPFASIVIKKGAADRQLVKAGEHIQSSVARAKRVSTEILSFTKPQALQRQPLDVGSWLRDAMVQLRPMIPETIDLHLELNHPGMHVNADRTQLTQVVTNLVLNARDAMEARGSITILACRPARNGFIQMDVIDTGKGMPPETMSRIFEPLFTTKGSSGTGLGLVVTRRIVEAHQGTIEVHSEEGKGTRFTISLPELAGGAGKRVLILLPAGEAAPLAAFLTANGFESAAADTVPPEGSGYLAIVSDTTDETQRSVLATHASRLILIGPGRAEASDRTTVHVEGLDLGAILDAIRAVAL